MPGEQSVVYCRCRPIEDARFDPVDGPPLSEALVDAIAAAAEADPTELPPLYEIVDLDVLGTLFDRKEGENARVFSFEYLTFQVFVTGDGRIQVCDRGQRTDPIALFGDASGQ